MIRSEELQKLDSIFLSEYILETGGPMSHLKLQKLLFYIDAFHLAYFNQGIIGDCFEAWLHGPVSRRVYETVKGQSVLFTDVAYHEENGKENPSQSISRLITKDQLELVKEVVEEYGKLSALKLESLTHSEAPWIAARQGYAVADRCNVAISKDLTRVYYKEQLYGEA